MTARHPCLKADVRATVVAIDGTRYVGTNAVGVPRSECPRVAAGYGFGQGYHLCKLDCRQPHHAEIGALLAAGLAAEGSTLYLEGHARCCEACLAACDVAGVARIVIGSPPGR